jgi:hypothetical protein
MPPREFPFLTAAFIDDRLVSCDAKKAIWNGKEYVARKIAESDPTRAALEQENSALKLKIKKLEDVIAAVLSILKPYVPD